MSRLLIGLAGGALGTDPTLSPLESWPIYATGEPQEPDNVITVFDTAGRVDGRTMPDGEVQFHHGFQVRIRASTPQTGYPKANQIALALDNFNGGTYYVPIIIGSDTYFISTVNRVGDVIPLGKDRPNSTRNLYTINALVTVRLAPV